MIKHYALTVHESNLLQLCELAIAQRVTHLWIMPDSTLEVTQDDSELTAAWDALLNWKYTEQVAAVLKNNILVSLHAYKKYPDGHHSARINIFFVKHLVWNVFKYINSGMELIERVQYLEKRLSVSVTGSASGTGMRFLRSLLADQNRQHWMSAPGLEFLQSPPWEEAARPIVWSRPITAAERTARYLWAVDKNGSYPRAAVEEHFGYGNPDHRDQDYAPLAWDGKRPGLWHVTVHEPEMVLQLVNRGEHPIEWELLPPPVPFDTQIWVTTPMLKCINKMGYAVTLHEAWIYTEYDHILRAWARKLWDLRQEFAPGDWRREAIKQLMNDTLGLFRSSKFGITERFRPDWNAIVVSGAAATMHYNMLKHAPHGYYPCMVQMDALYYCANALPEGILEQKESLGGYKLKWCLELTEEVKGILDSDQAQSMKLHALNQLAERSGYGAH